MHPVCCCQEYIRTYKKGKESITLHNSYVQKHSFQSNHAMLRNSVHTNCYTINCLVTSVLRKQRLASAILSFPLLYTLGDSMHESRPLTAHSESLRREMKRGVLSQPEIQWIRRPPSPKYVQYEIENVAIHK